MGSGTKSGPIGLGTKVVAGAEQDGDSNVPELTGASCHNTHALSAEADVARPRKQSRARRMRTGVFMLGVALTPGQHDIKAHYQPTQVPNAHM